MFSTQSQAPRRRGRRSNAQIAADLEAQRLASIQRIQDEQDATAGRERRERRRDRGPQSDPIGLARRRDFSPASQDLSGFSEMGRASRELNRTLGLDRTVGIIGPDANGDLGPIWNQLDDVKDEQLQLLKSVYGVSSREQLVIKLQEQAGLRKKTVHPLMKYRQASFMHDLTQNHYPCDWSRYVFPAVGNIKSTL